MKSFIILLLASTLILSGYLLYPVKNKDAVETRQELIHEKGSTVMPFDLDKTTHVFNQTETGGIQQIRVKDINDTEQIKLIREHLQEEEENFNSGNFEDPENLHGKEMPGLEVLRNNPNRFSVEYIELEDGAQLTYTTENPEIIDAFHMWFMAQLMDHGSDATHMMN